MDLYKTECFVCYCYVIYRYWIFYLDNSFFESFVVEMKLAYDLKSKLNDDLALIFNVFVVVESIGEFFYNISCNWK